MQCDLSYLTIPNLSPKSDQTKRPYGPSHERLTLQLRRTTSFRKTPVKSSSAILHAFYFVHHSGSRIINLNHMETKNIDPKLVHQAQSGDRNSLGQLSELVQERIYPFLYKVTLDHDLAQDLLQDTLLAIVRDISHLRNTDCFWPWTYRIAWNNIQRHFRNQQEESRIETAVHEHERRRRVIRESGGEILSFIVREETLKHLSIAVNLLKRQYKEILQLRCFAQLSYSEIAATLHCSRQQARVRLHRARQALKYNLRPVDYVED
jgi:RNA polymerase sigma-70 factor (ECF subfamily)